MTGHPIVDTDHVWDLAEKIQVAMLASWDGHALHARPMRAFVERETHSIYFLADKRDHNTDELERYRTICLAFGDASDHKYLSITGDASVSSDKAKIRELWGPWAKVWWASADDPNICVLRVMPTQAEYWDTPGGVVNTVRMAVGAMTGHRPEIGEHRKVFM
jgi:general stress protein 26